jgi:hypothetical protein
VVGELKIPYFARREGGYVILLVSIMTLASTKPPKGCGAASPAGNVTATNIRMMLSDAGP